MITTQDIRGASLPAAAFNDVALREGLRYVRRGTFPAPALTLAELVPLGDVELAERVQGGAVVLLRMEARMVVLIAAGRGQGEVAVAGDDREDVDRVTADLVASLHDVESDQAEVPVTFWAHAPGAPINPRRRITAPAWHEIRSNYAARTQPALDQLMQATGPGPGGLVLWHGEPGTGKSYALRALAREWRSWCETHFITDADAFLGGQTNYLLNALLRSERGFRAERRWRLVVLEDAGELLAADARATSGQALSRLLNVTDGLLGAGLRALVLVTTNEPIRRLHPAVVRPGRCWAEVEFARFAAGEGKAWLAERQVAGDLSREATLAELFAVADGRDVVERVGVGFGG